jgi:hypothetical protein
LVENEPSSSGAFSTQVSKQFNISRAWNQKVRLIIMGVFNTEAFFCSGQNFDYILGGTSNWFPPHPKSQLHSTAF